MVFKPSEETPLSVMRLAELFTQAGLPDGVFNVVQGDARVGQMLTAHPGIAKVSLQGVWYRPQGDGGFFSYTEGSHHGAWRKISTYCV